MGDFSRVTGIQPQHLEEMHKKYERARDSVSRKSNNLVDILETLVHAVKDQSAVSSGVSLTQMNAR